MQRQFHRLLQVFPVAGEGRAVFVQGHAFGVPAAEHPGAVFHVHLFGGSGGDDGAIVLLAVLRLLVCDFLGQRGVLHGAVRSAVDEGIGDVVLVDGFFVGCFVGNVPGSGADGGVPAGEGVAVLRVAFLGGFIACVDGRFAFFHRLLTQYGFAVLIHEGDGVLVLLRRVFPMAHQGDVLRSHRNGGDGFLTLLPALEGPDAFVLDFIILIGRKRDFGAGNGGFYQVLGLQISVDFLGNRFVRGVGHEAVADFHRPVRPHGVDVHPGAGGVQPGDGGEGVVGADFLGADLYQGLLLAVVHLVRPAHHDLAVGGHARQGGLREGGAIVRGGVVAHHVVDLHAADGVVGVGDGPAVAELGVGGLIVRVHRVHVHGAGRRPDVFVAVAGRVGHFVIPHLAVFIFHGERIQAGVGQLEVAQQVAGGAVAADRPDGAVAAVVAGGVIDFVGAAGNGEFAQVPVAAGVVGVGFGTGVQHAVGAEIEGGAGTGIICDPADQVLEGDVAVDGGAHHVHGGPLGVVVLPADVEQHRGAAAGHGDGAAVYLQVLVGGGDDVVFAVLEFNVGIGPFRRPAPAVIEVQRGVAAAAKGTGRAGAAVVDEMAVRHIPAVHLEEHIFEADVGVDDFDRRAGSERAGFVCLAVVGPHGGHAAGRRFQGDVFNHRGIAAHHKGQVRIRTVQGDFEGVPAVFRQAAQGAGAVQVEAVLVAVQVIISVAQRGIGVDLHAVAVIGCLESGVLVGGHHGAAAQGDGRIAHVGGSAHGDVAFHHQLAPGNGEALAVRQGAVDVHGVIGGHLRQRGGELGPVTGVGAGDGHVHALVGLPGAIVHVPVALGQVRQVPLGSVGDGQVFVVHNRLVHKALGLPDGQPFAVRFPGDHAVFFRQAVPCDGQRVDGFQSIHRVVLVDFFLSVFIHGAVVGQEVVQGGGHRRCFVQAVHKLVHRAVGGGTVVPFAHEMHGFVFGGGRRPAQERPYAGIQVVHVGDFRGRKDAAGNGTVLGQLAGDGLRHRVIGFADVGEFISGRVGGLGRAVRENVGVNVGRLQVAGNVHPGLALGCDFPQGIQLGARGYFHGIRNFKCNERAGVFAV